MKAGKNLNHAVSNSKKQTVWEAPKSGPARVAAHRGKLVGIIGKPCRKCSIFGHKTLPDTGCLTVVPILCARKIALGFRRERYPHYL